jgi:hypothetical protein
MNVRSTARGWWLVAAAGLAMSAALAACGGSGSGSATVPSLSAGSSGAGGAGTSDQSRAAALHAAAQCIRQHGVPGYQDPVLTPGGQVYTDSRSFDDAGPAVRSAVGAACRTLMVRASLHPDAEPAAPPVLVQAGVRAAECERGHGLPNVRDPNSNSPYTPGHGFGLSASEVPAGGKGSAGFQQALRACHSQIDAEIRASTLGNLSSNG